MRSWKIYAVSAAAIMTLAGFVAGQDGPMRDSGPTVARPRKPDVDAASPAEPDLPKIPSRLKKDATGDVSARPSFKSEVDLITVDAAVLDNKGHFIPGIPGGNFRILEDNVPQKIAKVEMGEAPMTVALVIEFSNKYQRYGSEVWYQTLQLAWGFASTLKPEDYCAVVAFDMHTEILTDFTTDRTMVRERSVVSDTAIGMGLCQYAETGGLLRGGGFRHAHGDPHGFHHGQDEGTGGLEPAADRVVVRGQPV